MIAARAMTPKLVPVVGLDHLHRPLVSVREQAALIVARLRTSRSCPFGSLVADAGSTLVIVARFLALLELFHESVIAFDQTESFGELVVRWTGGEDGEIGVSDEFDESEREQSELEQSELEQSELEQEGSLEEGSSLENNESPEDDRSLEKTEIVGKEVDRVE
jgi:segregation and condensation protein A